MATQHAAFLSRWIGSGVDGDPYRPAIFDVLQTPESAVDETGIPVPNLIPVKNAVLVLVDADEARIADAPALRVLWRKYHDEIAAAIRDRDEPMTDAEITALRNFLSNQYGFTAAEIAAWYGVTVLQLANWLKTHSRLEAGQRIIQAWRQLKQG